MTGKGHWATGLALAIATYKYTDTVGAVAWIATFFSFFGSTSPDWLEIRHKGGTIIKHRTITHWIPVWLFLFSFSLFSVNNDYLSFFYHISFFSDNQIPPLYSSALLGFSIGGLLHLLFDLPNPMGVPLFTPWNRVSLNLWKSGEMEKTIVTLVFITALIYVFFDYILILVPKIINLFSTLFT